MIMAQEGETSKGCISMKCNQVCGGSKRPETQGNTKERHLVKFGVLVQSDQREVPPCDSQSIVPVKFSKCVFCQFGYRTLALPCRLGSRSRGQAASASHTKSYHVLIFMHSLSFLLWLQELLHRHPPGHPAVIGSPYWRSGAPDKWFHFNYRLE